MGSRHIDNLKNRLDTLRLSVEWLRRSYEQCSAIGIKETYTKDEFDRFENLTSRYARTADMLVNQVLRSLDAVELLDSGTVIAVIDIMNRAEKRGIVPAAAALRDLKDLRNEITHEYQITKIELFFDLVLTSTPLLLSITEKTFSYARRYTNGES